MCTQIEVEVEADESTVAESGDSSLEVVNLNEDEVVLYWNESNSWNYIHEMANEDTDENKELLAYYRSVCHGHLRPCGVWV